MPSEHRKAATCLMEKKTLLHKVCSGFPSQVVALLAAEFAVNESAIYMTQDAFRQKPT